MPNAAKQLTVFGATGGTGTEFVRAALTAGNSVTAVARDPWKLKIRHGRLGTVRGDVLDAASIKDSIRGADAVVSALGVGSGREATTVYSTGVGNILYAMADAGVQRFVGISALPVAPRDQVGLIQRRLAFPILYRFFGESYADMARMEQQLRASNIAWTVLRPPRLTNGPARGHYRTTVDGHLRRAGKISRADLAQAMLHALDDPRALQAAITVAY